MAARGGRKLQKIFTTRLSVVALTLPIRLYLITANYHWHLILAVWYLDSIISYTSHAISSGDTVLFRRSFIRLRMLNYLLRSSISRITLVVIPYINSKLSLWLCGLMVAPQISGTLGFYTRFTEPLMMVCVSAVSVLLPAAIAHEENKTRFIDKKSVRNIYKIIGLIGSSTSLIAWVSMLTIPALIRAPYHENFILLGLLSSTVALQFINTTLYQIGSVSGLHSRIQSFGFHLILINSGASALLIHLFGFAGAVFSLQACLVISIIVTWRWLRVTS